MQPQRGILCGLGVIEWFKKFKPFKLFESFEQCEKENKLRREAK